MNDLIRKLRAEIESDNYDQSEALGLLQDIENAADEISSALDDIESASNDVRKTLR